MNGGPQARLDKRRFRFAHDHGSFFMGLVHLLKRACVLAHDPQRDVEDRRSWLPH
jgi:hypothetical protein